MGNSVRCCLACVIPCGALDVIRIVHLNGYVDEISRPITAQQFLNSFPNHVLTKPFCQGLVRKILILSPHSQLKRGAIYFLIPNSSLPSSSSSSSSSSSKPKILNTLKPQLILKPYNHATKPSSTTTTTTAASFDVAPPKLELDQQNNNASNIVAAAAVVVGVSDAQSNKSLLKSKTVKHQRRRSSRGSKSGIWHPHLHSITEDDF